MPNENHPPSIRWILGLIAVASAIVGLAIIREKWREAKAAADIQEKKATEAAVGLEKSTTDPSIKQNSPSQSKVTALASVIGSCAFLKMESTESPTSDLRVKKFSDWDPEILKSIPNPFREEIAKYPVFQSVEQSAMVIPMMDGKEMLIAVGTCDLKLKNPYLAARMKAHQAIAENLMTQVKSETTSSDSGASFSSRSNSEHSFKAASALAQWQIDGIVHILFGEVRRK